MCAIVGIFNLRGEAYPSLSNHLHAINRIQSHRGPDGEGVWTNPKGHIGFGHRRLSIIDLESGNQPMRDQMGNRVIHNGEIYNYIELREELGRENFTTKSDTEVILHAYRKWGYDCVNHFRGMFAFALWDEAHQTLFCARDRFGIKPLYYTQVGDMLYCASEVKALLPFLKSVEIDLEAFKDYLTFQFCLAGKTLFKDVCELPAGHMLMVKNGSVETRRYWEIYFHLDFDHTDIYFKEELRNRIIDSVRLHLRSDVPLGAYVSGGIDSGVIASLANKRASSDFIGFMGKFSSFGQDYDESSYARLLSDRNGFPLKEIDITVDDFVNNIKKVIYHLDYPVAGPGSFAQYMVSGLAARHRKVCLGGQGGDEIFGGYTRYLIAYFEQCIKGAIDGTMRSGNFIVTYESIIPNLTALQKYKPLLKEFWGEGLFEAMDARYFRLINRAARLKDEIKWDLLGDYSPFETFKTIFNGNNVRKESYFDLMTHFDFKTLLPALLHVEDRISMAHGLESRVPFLDHPIVELSATIPSNIKFCDGNMKHIFKEAIREFIPDKILKRQDKMGFPTPLTEWIKGDARDFVYDLLSSQTALNRELIDNRKVLEGLDQEPRFGRRMWGFMCLEIWQQEFLDKAYEFRSLLNNK
ncbi:MAG: asparagine synthase (glutamine-hydrolyzing) [Thermodesulfobacteriota bacterium]|nr:asparagine synthase (glutamine-hydrolyzing) [Thermodesulfobacteriota bacterium]